MKNVTIKRTTKDVPVMILIAGLFLFPALYIMYDNEMGGIAFIIAALFALLVIVIAVYGFVVIFKYDGFFTLTNEGVAFQDNDRKENTGYVFYRWEDITSYRINIEKDRYYSNEMNTYVDGDVHSIILTLENGSSRRILTDKLSKKPAQIIALFDLYSSSAKTITKI